MTAQTMTFPRRFAAVVIVILLSACAGPGQTSSDPVGACTATARQDPDVEAVRNKQLAGFYQNYLFEADYKQALNRAIDRCLAAKGLARPGGVEAVRHD
jgi:hypothetical protein